MIIKSGWKEHTHTRTHDKLHNYLHDSFNKITINLSHNNNMMDIWWECIHTSSTGSRSSSRSSCGIMIQWRKLWSSVRRFQPLCRFRYIRRDELVRREGAGLLSWRFLKSWHIHIRAGTACHREQQLICEALCAEVPHSSVSDDKVYEHLHTNKNPIPL